MFSMVFRCLATDAFKFDSVVSGTSNLRRGTRLSCCRDAHTGRGCWGVLDEVMMPPVGGLSEEAEGEEEVEVVLVVEEWVEK